MYRTLLATLLLVVLAIAAVYPAVGKAQEGYKWVFMVYMAADNNLEPAGIEDLNEMELVGSTNDVAIVVLFDRHPGYDTSNGNWTGTRIYLVKHDEDTETINSELLADLGERDTGDPQTLIDFVKFVVERFPAEHYALVIWDHGNGWKFREFGVRGVAWDETDGMDYLTLQELRYAFSVLASENITFDIVGFDACLMQMAEVVFELADFTKFVVASEEYEPFDGWEYNYFLQDLVANPSMSAADLAKDIVEAYKTYYLDQYGLSWATLSAVNTTAFKETLIPALDTFARVATFSVFFYPDSAYLIKEARDASEKFGYGDYIDLGHFAKLVNSTSTWVGEYDPRAYAYDVYRAVNKTVIAAVHGPAHPNATGLTIYFPPDVDWYLEERYLYFQQASLSYMTWWGYLLEFYFKVMTPREELWVKVNAPAITVPSAHATVTIVVGYGKALIDPDALTVYVIGPDATVTYLTAQRIATGIYVATFTVPETNASETYTVVAEVDYWFLRTYGSAPMTVSVELKTAATGVGDILANLDELRTELNSTAALLVTKLGTIELGIEDLKSILENTNAQLAAIKGDVAIIVTDVGTIVTKVSKLKELELATQSKISEAKASITSEIQSNTQTLKEDIAKLNEKVYELVKITYALIGAVIFTLVIALTTLILVTRKK